MTANPTPSTPHEASRAGHIVRGVLLASAAGVMCWVLATRPASKSTDAGLSVPALPHISAHCAGDPMHAEHRSKHALRAAIARAERYTFEPQDGMIALERFAEARVCAEIAGSSVLLEEASHRAARHSARIHDDYTKHVTRYRLARDVGRVNEATEDIEFLIQLLGKHMPSEVRQLRLDQLELERQASARERR